ncbi:MAG: hypothetical protein ABI175_14685 [Polyangiales bacterium]
MSLHRLVPIVLVIAACSSEDRRPAPSPPPAAPQLAHATQADLARELGEAEHRGTWQEVRRRWQGQKLRWTVIRHASLCSTAERCNVAAFPVQRPAAQGWMPLLQFAPGQFDALVASCGDRADCEVTIEGTLAELDASGERATKMRFSDVSLAGGTLATR